MLASACHARIDADNFLPPDFNHNLLQHITVRTLQLVLHRKGINRSMLFVTVRQKELPSPAALAAQQQSIGTLVLAVSSRQCCSKANHETCALHPH